MQKRRQCTGVKAERGVTLVFLGLALAMLLGVTALAVDLGMLYVGRSEAQRAADAAALAGAQVFSSSGCTSGNCQVDVATQGLARSQAEVVGDKNYVLNQQVNVQDSDVSFSFPSSTEPQITVTVWRKNVPLLFAKIFGDSLANVSAAATAEAFQSGNENMGCPIPFAIANCDTNTNDSFLPATNSVCPVEANGTTQPSYFVCCSSNNYSNVDTNVLGQPILLHFQTSNGATVPSQWYLLAFGGIPSGSQLESYIQACPTSGLGCGNVPVTTGDKVGPVDQGVDTLINAMGPSGTKPTDGMNAGQDTIQINSVDQTTGSVSYTITGGSDNQTPGFVGTSGLTTSRSLVTVPVYNQVVGTTTSVLTSGQPQQQSVQVVAYAQLFIVDAEAPGSRKGTDPCNPTGQVSNGDSPVCAYVIRILPTCSNTTGSTVNTEWSPVPIRLIQGPTQ